MRSRYSRVLAPTSGYLKQAQDSRDISEYAYKRGAASLLDFLDAERSYRSVQLAYRQALASHLGPADCKSRSACAFLCRFSPLRSLQ